jgi:Autotransporter beta-domain
MNPSKFFSLSQCLLFCLALLFSFKSFAADNPAGTTLTSTLTGASPLTNEGTITVNNGYGISGSGGVITNSGTVSVTGANNHGISATGDVNLTNSGSVSSAGGASRGIIFWQAGVGGTITNTVTGVVSGETSGVEIQRNSTLNNAGRIVGNSTGLSIFSTTDVSITNTGAILGGGFSGIYNGPGAVVSTLNNLQGGDGSSESQTGLVYKGGFLPINYNIIISSPDHYGQVVVPSATGSTAFGIYPGSSITTKLYKGVVQGLYDNNIGPTRTGTYDNMNWTLALQSGSSNTWDLSFTGTSLAQTQSSLASHARKLLGIYNHASLISNFANSNTYDCNLFDVRGMCISAGGRYSTVDNPSSNSTAAVVTLGYKVNSNIRIGGFLDQSVNNNSPTGIDISNKHPMMGAFAYWNQNADGLGYQVKIANAYQDKDLSTTRDVIGTSEAGTGKTTLNTQSYVGELSYAFMYKENTLVRPYFALRHTSIEQDAYTETGVTTPLTYSALNDRTTSALMGVKFKHAITEKTKLTGSLGVEQDLHHKTDQLIATGVSGLTSENLASDLHRTRPVASIGATYDIAKSQRLSGEVLVQQLPFQSTVGATAYFNYMIGF